MLSDEQKRSMYDQFGEAGVKGGAAGGAGAYGAVCGEINFILPYICPSTYLKFKANMSFVKDAPFAFAACVESLY